MITYLLMNLVKWLFWLVLNILKSIAPTYFTTMTQNLSNLLASNGAGFAIFLINLIVPITFLQTAIGTAIVIALTGIMIKYIKGVISK